VVAAGTPVTGGLTGRVRLLRLPRRRDERGSLLPLDAAHLPFAPQRVFVIHDVPRGTQRGGHAHRSNRQLLVCLSGALNLEVRADGEEGTLLLQAGGPAALLEPGVWARQTYLQPGTVLMVLASEPYSPDSFVDEADPA
jgi:dTDP-4-dehydrorhamnose 3,5-epimerase-like enzyme